MVGREYIACQPMRLQEAAGKKYDVLIVGAGVAGMTTALSLDPKLRVGLISKGQLRDSSTYKAQGGMAVAVGQDDSIETHREDTLRVGQGICCEESVQALVSEGPEALCFLESLGARFCHNGDALALTREGGHTRNRVVHYYDYSGKYIAEILHGEVAKRPNIEQIENSFLVDLLTAQDSCCGCMIERNGRLFTLAAAAVVVATGGYSGLFARSTNAVSSCGDGIAAAYRAGAVLADMEFVQFHPTTFAISSGNVFLLTEALRGEGAVLLNAARERFMPNYHYQGELAPRDEVSRAVLREVNRLGGPVFLDIRHLGKEYLTDRFRQVYSELAQNNYFLEQDIIPIAPAAHYTIGGIKTDLWGRTNIPSLYACGEAAATGVHGANRLASNSLLEGVVFGRRVALSINQDFPKPRSICQFSSDGTETVLGYPDTKLLRSKLDQAAGVIRCQEELTDMADWLSEPVKAPEAKPIDSHGYSAYNEYQLAKLVVEAALFRQESRGTHYRTDFPETSTEFQKHTLQQWGRKVAMQ